jgi:hypothetical protein
VLASIAIIPVHCKCGHVSDQPIQTVDWLSHVVQTMREEDIQAILGDRILWIMHWLRVWK